VRGSAAVEAVMVCGRLWQARGSSSGPEVTNEVHQRLNCLETT
jgi:hypothetical protein